MVVGTGIPFCSWCISFDGLHNEATWVVEVRTPDEEVSQRLLGCSLHAREVFELMDIEAVPSNYSVVRRYTDSDAILTFDEIGTDEPEQVA